MWPLSLRLGSIKKIFFSASLSRNITLIVFMTTIIIMRSGSINQFHTQLSFLPSMSSFYIIELLLLCHTFCIFPVYYHACLIMKISICYCLSLFVKCSAPMDSQLFIAIMNFNLFIDHTLKLQLALANCLLGNLQIL